MTPEIDVKMQITTICTTCGHEHTDTVFMAEDVNHDLARTPGRCKDCGESFINQRTDYMLRHKIVDYNTFD